MYRLETSGLAYFWVGLVAVLGLFVGLFLFHKLLPRHRAT